MTTAMPHELPRSSAHWFGTLKARLMLASALVIAASVAVSTLVVLQRVQGRSVQAVMDLEGDNAERVASLLVQRVVGMQKALRASAGALPLVARTDRDAAAAFLQSNPALAVPFASVFVADTAGRLLALYDGSVTSQPELGLAGRDYFAQTLAQGVPVVSVPVPGRVSKEPIIQLTMPVIGEGGAVVAVLGGTLRLASRNLFDDLTYAGSGSANSVVTIVTDARGDIISHPQRERVMQAIETEPGLADMAARWAAQGRPVEPTGLVVHEHGLFIAMAGVPGADWMVFRMAPDTELLGGMVQARGEALEWAGGVALLGGLLILALLAVLLGPLSQLRRRALTLQDPSRPVDEGWPMGQGEIGELGRVLQQVLRERAQGEHASQLLAQQMGSVLAAAPIGIAFTRAQRFELAGAEFCAQLGWSDGELLGRAARDIFASEDDYDRLGPEVCAAFATGRPYFGEWLFRRRDGFTFWGRLQGRPVDRSDPAAGTIWLLEDVTDAREARERLSWSANHDTLTRLLNRGAFEERLAAWLAKPEVGTSASLLFIDLDHFKQINDNAGHAAGDDVLREVASTLHDHVRPGDLVARLGGDEFALLFAGCGAETALPLAERLRHAISLIGVEHEGRVLRVGASIGVVEIDLAAGASVSTWLARADAACYQAKDAGRDAVRLAPPASAGVNLAPKLLTLVDS